MTSEKLEIVIVDDDAAVCDSLKTVFELEGFHVRTYSDGDLFLAEAQLVNTDCLILDIHMPRRSGLEILQAVGGDQYRAPIFIISGQGDIPTAVNAIKAGAHDFIEKPFDAETVIARVREAVAVRRKRSLARAGPCNLFPGSELLTPREREVLEKIANGASNKEAGRALAISPRTIEVHRARLMEKLGARSAADLGRIVSAATGR